ncbi:hypothetical protein [Massilia pseudoviolaceinigra]|uniref:hypothetical protein n=1 Tax=Massilia pseudoviolaceinigra TaxID=3057165 RepID=UPI002796E07D|nr:hypothetical protein [Massilia sp. CCM 9206]MDQ1925105.1 hypothetical protein [Massilia sp. CCM 9206]
MTNEEPFSSADLFEYHKATGCPVMKVKAELLSMEPELRSRVFKAALTQPREWGGLRDPIENDPATRELVGAAAREAETLVGATAGRGRCHRIWIEQKRVLALQGISWFSPVEMNPWTVFD